MVHLVPPTSPNAQTAVYSHNSQTCSNGACLRLTDSQLLWILSFSERLLGPDYLCKGPFEIRLHPCFMLLCLLTIPYIPYGIMLTSIPSLPSAPIHSQSVQNAFKRFPNASRHSKTLPNVPRRLQTLPNVPRRLQTLPKLSQTHPNAPKTFPTHLTNPNPSNAPRKLPDVPKALMRSRTRADG